MHRLARHGLALAAGILLTSCAGTVRPELEPGAGFHDVTFTARDGDTQEPVPDARIRLEKIWPDRALHESQAARITDGSGFAHVNVGRGGYILTVDADGYRLWRSELEVSGNREVELPLRRAPVRAARPLAGRLRACGRSYCDDTGPRKVYGLSWFPALHVLRHEPGTFHRQLDRIAAAGWQFVRIFHAVGGWDPFWNDREVAPVTFRQLRDWNAPSDRVVEGWPDYDDVLRRALRAFRDRDLKVVLTSGDLQAIFPESPTDPSREIAHFRRVARIAAEVDPRVVALFEVANEMWQNHALRWSAHTRCPAILAAAREHLPEVLTACSEATGGEDPGAIAEWATEGAAVSTIHGTRQDWPEAIRRAFELVHRNGQPGFWRLPFWQGEPTGPDGSHPEVFMPTNDPAALWGLYATHLITGQASTYFNGPAVRYREPLDVTWGFAELPELYRHIPDDVGQWPIVTAGDLHHAPLTAAAFRSAGAPEGPDRVDQVSDGARVLAVVSAGAGRWRIYARRALRYRVVGPDGIEAEGRAGAFEVIPGLHAGLRARLIVGAFE